MTPEQAMAAIRRLIDAEMDIAQGMGCGHHGTTKKAIREEAAAVAALFKALTGQFVTDDQIKAMVEV